MTHEPGYPLVIYYDAACPLCAREMAALSRHDHRRRLRLVDCSAPGFSDADARAAGIEASAMMQLIHARDADGRWHRGVDVFVLAYRAAGIHAVSRFWGHRRLKPLWDRLYPWVARHRMALSRIGLTRPFGWWVERAARRASQRSQACQTGTCDVP